MDGYALRAAEAGSSLPVAFRIAAGDDPPDLPPGTAAEIATGAPLPDGADAVVPVELAREEDGRLVVEGAVKDGDHVRLPGEDAHAGDVVLAAGTRLSPLAVAGAATSGVDQSWSCAARGWPSWSPGTRSWRRASRSAAARSTTRTAC